MRNMILTSAFLVTALGCGNIVSDSESMAKDVCECADSECAEKAMEAHKGKYSDDDFEALSDEDKAEVEAYLAAAALCAMGHALSGK